MPALQPFRPAMIAAVVGIGAHLAGRFVHGQPLTVMAREMAFALGIVVWAVLTVPVSYWPGGSASFLLDTYLKTLAIFWLLANVVNTLPRLRQVAWALSLMSVPLALTAIHNYRTRAFIDDGGSVKRILGYGVTVAANPNDLALMLCVILPLTVGLLLAGPRPLARALLAAIVVLEAVGVVVTFSRAGFLLLATTAVLYVWRLARRGREGWAAALVGLSLAGLVFLPPDYVARVSTITDLDADPTGSSQVRWADTQAALRYVAHHPLIGTGIGMNSLALNDLRGGSWFMVHNVYLEYAMDLGLVGLALFVLLFARCLGRVRSVQRRTASIPRLRQLACLAEGLEIALVTFGVAGFFYPVAYQFYFYYLAGLAVATGTIHFI